MITATLNCEGTLADCFASLACQSHLDREHIIVDGASTDGTIGLIKRHIKNDAKFICEADKGIYDALNKGIHLATGDVIGFLHSDDVYSSENVLSKIAKAFEDPGVSAVYGDLEYVDREDNTRVVRRWKSKPFKRRYLDLGWMPAHPTLYVRREWYNRIGGFNVSYRISADYLSILRLFGDPGFRPVHIPDVLVKMRLGGSSNRSIRAIICKMKEDLRALRTCGFSVTGALGAVMGKNLSKLVQFV